MSEKPAPGEYVIALVGLAGLILWVLGLCAMWDGVWSHVLVGAILLFVGSRGMRVWGLLP